MRSDQGSGEAGARSETRAVTLCMLSHQEHCRLPLQGSPTRPRCTWSGGFVWLKNARLWTPQTRGLLVRDAESCCPRSIAERPIGLINHIQKGCSARPLSGKDFLYVVADRTGIEMRRAALREGIGFEPTLTSSQETRVYFRHHSR